MDSPVKIIDNSAEEKQLQLELDKKANYAMLKWCLAVFSIVACIVFFIFVYAHPWNFTLCADSEQWGQYGDFIGGFLGTLIAFLSVYYLIKTLREQVAANRKAADNNLAIANVNLLQQTDTKIKHLLTFYKEVRESYQDKIPEHKTLNERVILLKGTIIKSKDNYQNRNYAAKEVFDKEFYIPCKPIAAVQFRVLYQIMCLIHTIDDKQNKDIKLFYGKMVRSQLSEDELLLLRYNCQCKYGEAMRKHINQYNLLKHLPPLSLIEFQYWSMNVLEDEVLQNAMDTELIAERKEIRKLMRNAENGQRSKKEKDLFLSSKYRLHIEYSSNHMEFIYCLTRKNNLPDIEHIDEAFSVLGNDHTIDFIKDFLHEALEYSNFQDYNNGLQYIPKTNQYDFDQDKNETVFKVIVKSDTSKEIIMNFNDYLARNPETNQ